MKELQKKAILLSLVEKMREHNSWASETHIQKCVYFLQEGRSVPLDYNYILYKYGPFSFELRDEISEMVSEDYIKLVPQYPYGPSHKEGRLSPNLKRRFPKTLRKYADSIEFIAREISDNKVAKLEEYATALYFLSEEEITDDHECAEEIVAVKPHISFEEAEEAVEKVKGWIC